MVALKKYQNKKIAIYGMGITGCSAAEAFKSLNAKVFCWDDNKKVRNRISKKFSLNKFWLSSKIIDVIVISPGIDINKCKLKNYLKKNYRKIITDLDLFFELNRRSVIVSITGTNGKSTTCKIIEKILKAAKFKVKTLGNIGVPILSSKKVNKKQIFILEVSSYQLQYSKIFRSKHAAILNISPDHLERHNNIKEYAKVKSKIFYGQKNSDYSYLNLNNKYSKLISSIFKNKNLKSKLILINKFKYNFLLKKIKNKYFKSDGNYENLIFSYCIAKKLKISDKIIIKAVNEFKGLPHRQEILFSNKKIICVNDSKATSFDASLQCLQNYNKIYWILGGLPKYQDHLDLRKISKKVIKAYIIGKDPTFFSKQLQKKIPFMISHNIKKALKNIYYDLKNANKDEKSTILLSPAAASFDQFQNFEERGNQFKFLLRKVFKNLLYV